MSSASISLKLQNKFVNNLIMNLTLHESVTGGVHKKNTQTSLNVVNLFTKFNSCLCSYVAQASRLFETETFIYSEG